MREGLFFLAGLIIHMQLLLEKHKRAAAKIPKHNLWLINENES